MQKPDVSVSTSSGSKVGDSPTKPSTAQDCDWRHHWQLGGVGNLLQLVCVGLVLCYLSVLALACKGNLSWL